MNWNRVFWNRLGDYFMNSKRTIHKEPITNLLTFIVDNRGKTVPTESTGIPLIATNCIHDERLFPVYENIRFVSQETYDNWFRAHLKPGDILFVNKGTPGRCCLVPDPVSFCAAQDMIGLRCDKNKIYNRYLLMALRSPEIKKFISNNHVGLVIPHFKKEELSNLIIPLPDMKEQILLGDLYYNLSIKIEDNLAICSELESIAKLLYDYWFVQFDFPDENGKPYKSSGGKMVWNEELRREIPAGWETQRIGKLILTERGISYSTPNIKSGNGVPMLNLATFRPGGGDYKAEGLKYFLGDYPKNKVLKPYDLIMCNTQQTTIKFETDIIGRAMLVPDIFDGDVVFSHHVNVIRTQDENLKYYLLFLFNSDYLHKYISGFTNGTNILGLSFNGVEDYLIEIPDHAILEKFGKMVLETEKKKSEIITENQQLASLRDFLLPMLMNGQVKVRD